MITYIIIMMLSPSVKNKYNACFETSSNPDVWSHGIIHPIIKDSKNDRQDPFNFRDITITSVTYKLYYSILNNRLSR